MKIAPSLLSCDFKKIGEELQEIEKAGADWAHLDVMDGMFVPNISFGIPVIKSIRSASNIFFDVHLMIEEPIRYIEQFADAGADMITVHVEACQDTKATIEKIKVCGKLAGLSIKPNTQVKDILEYLPLVDMVLVMTVEPGFGGQSLIFPCLDKVTELKEIRKEKGYQYEIEIDGGVNKKTIDKVREIGPDISVAGSAVFNAADRALAINELR